MGRYDGPGMVGRVYLLSGEPVTVLVQWRTGPRQPGPVPIQHHRGPRPAPRNVLIRLRDGRQLVRPARGLRLPRMNELAGE